MTERTESRIGNPGRDVKIAAGIFWADYGYLAATVEELEAGGVDWIHMELRDGKYMEFNVPRGGIDVLMGIRKYTSLEIEVQLQVYRPNRDLLKQLVDEGASLISLPIETSGETLIQNLTYLQELGCRGGVWGWQGCIPALFEQCLPFVDVIEYECRYPFWAPVKPGGGSPHEMDPIVIETVGRLYDLLRERGLEKKVDLMEDGGLNKGNLEDFVSRGMSVGEFSSPLLKGPHGRFVPGKGDIANAVWELRKVLTELSQKYRTEDGGLK